MKSFIRPAVENAIAALHVRAVRLSEKDAATLANTLVNRFGDGTAPILHWNHLAEYAAVQHPDSWRWVGEFLGDEPVFLLFNPADEPSVYELGSGLSVVSILEECPGFEFYLADTALTFLLAQNDHDYLFGCGRAISWIRSLEPRHVAWAAQIAASKPT